MALLLPIVIGSSVGGFIMGYYYSGTGEQDSDETFVQDSYETFVQDFKTIKENNPRKEMHDELYEFKKDSLKKINKSVVITSNERLFIDNLRKKILERRDNIKPKKE